tara:strand:+ start:605 stop:1879 length:1275 start_codon:yes stop_codon:yes gene_type:complete
MILKGSQRGGGQNLAAHLMRMDDNEHVRLHELRGFASDDLREAFKEAEAIARGTNCRQYLFSLSLNPPEDANLSEQGFEQAIDQVEARLGLSGQPRAIVFHEKEGRRHAHCVWSRTDAQTMTARQLSFFKKKLQGVSRELYLENGWKLPRGLESPAERNPTNFTLEEWQQAKRQDVDPRWLKSTVQECWQHSDGRKAFESSLGERGFLLARGDKRGHVIIDHHGEVYSLPRMLGVKTKDVRARLGDGNDLKSVAQAQAIIGQRMTPAIRRHVAESRNRFRERSNELAKQKEKLTQQHRAARLSLDNDQRAEWDRETFKRAARLPKGLRGLWHRLTGKYQQVRTLNEAEARATRERHAQARQVLIDQQRKERALLQVKFKELRHDQAKRLSELRRDVGRFIRLARGDARSPGRKQSQGLRLGLSR